MHGTLFFIHDIAHFINWETKPVPFHKMGKQKLNKLPVSLKIKMDKSLAKLRNGQNSYLFLEIGNVVGWV